MSATDFGLNVHVISFSLPPDVIKDRDDCRVSVTTMPEQNKQAFIIKGQDMNRVHKFFTLNITPNTQKVIFVFRKLGLFQADPIVASTILPAKDFPKDVSAQNDRHASTPLTIPIFEPVQGEYHHSRYNRKRLGQLRIALQLTQSFPDMKYETEDMSSNVRTFNSAYGSCGNTSYGSYGNTSYESCGNNRSSNYGKVDHYTGCGNSSNYGCYGNASKKAYDDNENRDKNLMNNFSSHFRDEQIESNNYESNQQYDNQQQMNQQYGNQQQMNQQYGNQQQMNPQYGNQQQMNQQYPQQMNQQYPQQMNQQYGNQQQMNQQYGNQQQMNQQYGNQQQMNQQYPQQMNQQYPQQMNQQPMNQQYANQQQGGFQQYQYPQQMNQQYANQQHGGFQQFCNQNNAEPNLIDF